MKEKSRLILATAGFTTLAWFVIAGAVLWLASNGEPSAHIQFAAPGEMDVFSGAYRVQVIATNSVDSASSLLLSHVARAPERVSFKVERLETKTAQR